MQLVPQDQLGQLDPAIFTRELSAKWQEEILERELITMLTPIHVENSGVVFGLICARLITFYRLKSAQAPCEALDLSFLRVPT